MRPKLRPVQPTLIQHRGQPAILLRDPLRLTDRAVAVPQVLAPLLELCDGTRDANGLAASLLVRAGVRISPASLSSLLDELDRALLLENERYERAMGEALRAYRTAPFRPPILAGESYPADPDELADSLQNYMKVASLGNSSSKTEEDIRGLISPHIDYQRGGKVYAQVWGQSAEALRATEIAIVFGTDHLGGQELLTLTQQNYATPWGVLPTARDVVNALADALGAEASFKDELHHRSEHSIELALVWLHYMLNGSDCQIVPILCGPFDHYIENEECPQDDERIAVAIQTLRQSIGDRRTIVVAAADLAHVGPAFGDSYPLDFVWKARLRATDEKMLGTICAGDADGFFRFVQAERDRRRICGLAPIYWTLRLLGRVRGQVVGYEVCPADQQRTSFVSVCGILLT